MKQVIQVILNDVNESFAVNDAHKARNISNMTEGNGFPRVDSLVRILALALRGTSRIEHLDKPDNQFNLPIKRLLVGDNHPPARYNHHSWFVEWYIAT